MQHPLHADVLIDIRPVDTLSCPDLSDGAWRIASETPTFPGPVIREPLDAKRLVALLDEAGIQRALVLSTAYSLRLRCRLRGEPHPAPELRRLPGDAAVD